MIGHRAYFPTTMVFPLKNYLLRGNFDALRRSLVSLDLLRLISNDGSIDEGWSRWKNVFHAAANEHIPTRTLHSRHHVPWINSDILYKIKKNTVRRRLKRKPSENLQSKFKSLRALIKEMMKDSRTNYINSLCTNKNTNPKRFWSLFKNQIQETVHS